MSKFLIHRSLLQIRTLSKQISMNLFERYDPQQVALLDEPLIVVDMNDKMIGRTTKKEAHLLSNIEQEPTLIHRAFSFFLFDHSRKPSRLILQQRSAEKITYPLLWANTCCSHPLHNENESQGLDGVKRAVRRRVQYELGHEIKVNPIYRTRIFYQARNIPDDGIFGESEVDYIIFGHYHGKTPLDLRTDFDINENEIKEIDSLTLEECETLVHEKRTTPWFTRLIQQGLLAQWWKEFEQSDFNECDQQTDEVIRL